MIILSMLGHDKILTVLDDNPYHVSRARRTVIQQGRVTNNEINTIHLVSTKPRWCLPLKVKLNR